MQIPRAGQGLNSSSKNCNQQNALHSLVHQWRAEKTAFDDSLLNLEKLFCRVQCAETLIAGVPLGSEASSSVLHLTIPPEEAVGQPGQESQGLWVPVQTIFHK